jgi:hypothetical protein
MLKCAQTFRLRVAKLDRRRAAAKKEPALPLDAAAQAAPD